VKPRHLRVAIAAAAIAIAIVPVHGEERVLQPYEMARSLQLLQDGIAHGNRAMLAAQQKLLDFMADRFLAADPKIWKDQRNFYALIVHTLSGGDPKVLRSVLALNVVAEADQPLAKGTLAYAEGRNREAAELLMPIDARTMPPSVTGYIALTQAALSLEQDPKKAQQLLSLARLMMPGTLIEEGALRRQITSVAKDGDVESFEHLARNELTRFTFSVYGSAFRSQLAEAVVDLDYGGRLGRLDRLEAMLQAIEPSVKEQLYLTIARRALVRGKITIAQFAADNALRAIEGEETENLQAQLYAATAALVTDDFEGARETLKSIDRKELGDDDRELLDNALALAERMRAMPAPAGKADPPREQRGIVMRPSPEDLEPIKDILERAEKAIQRTDQFLKSDGT
jgi:chemotaxis protein MotC